MLVSKENKMIEGLLFWLDLGLMIYLCWRVIKIARDTSNDLGLFAFKESKKSK